MVFDIYEILILRAYGEHVFIDNQLRTTILSTFHVPQSNKKTPFVGSIDFKWIFSIYSCYCLFGFLHYNFGTFFFASSFELRWFGIFVHIDAKECPI